MTDFDARYAKAVRDFEDLYGVFGESLSYNHPIYLEYREVRRLKFHAHDYNANCYAYARAYWIRKPWQANAFDDSPVYQPVLDKIHEGDYHGAERLLKDAGILT